MDPVGFDILDLSGKDGRIYDSNSPHRHTFFELFFFESGKGTHEIDFNIFPLEARSVHFVSPGQIHQLSLKQAKGWVLCFTEDFISLKSRANFAEYFPFYNGSKPVVMKLDKALSGEITFLVDSVSQEVKARHIDQTELVNSYLHIILLKLKAFFITHRQTPTGEDQKKAQKIGAFKKLVNEKFMLHLPVSGYAHLLNISPNYLNALCKKHEGQTAIRLIHDRVLLEAKRLLYGTDMDIKEISFFLNFEDVSYYNRFFKKLTRLTPLQYRELSRKNH